MVWQLCQNFNSGPYANRLGNVANAGGDEILQTPTGSTTSLK